MKKIFNILAVSLSVIALASCSDDTENPYAHEPALTIISSNVVFDAPSSNGTVVVDATSAITAELNSSWATATVNGNTVNVAVEQNNAPENRTSVLTIRCGADSVNVTVQQAGLIFRLSASAINTDDKATTLSYALKSNAPVQLSTSADWIKVNQTTDSLLVSLSENNTGHMRSGYIYYVAGESKDSISVKQCEFEKDIVGNYYLLFTKTPNADRYSYFNAVVDETGITIPTIGLTIPATFDENDFSINTKCGAYLGQNGPYHCYDQFQLSDGYWTAYYNNTTAWGEFDYDNEEGVTYTYIDKSTSSFQFTGITISAFNEKKFDASVFVGTLIDMYWPLLQKADDASGAKNMMKAKKAVLKTK